MGPITNDNATPREPQSDATAVAVVLSLRGNHADDSNGGAACVTGPATPLRNCPATIVLKRRQHSYEIESEFLGNVPNEVAVK